MIKNRHKIKSLLRYPGGKTRAIKVLDKYIPDDAKDICSPFFGGGSFEFHLISKGCNVVAGDIYKPLVSFWNKMMERPDLVADLVQSKFPLEKQDFYQMQKDLAGEKNEMLQAVYFYVLNRASYSGTTSSGGMSPGHPRFTQSQIDKLRNWYCDDLSIEQISFEDIIAQNKERFFYLDPPYYIANFLYGNKGNTHKGFDHTLLRDCLLTIDNWVLSYNDCEEVRELYKDFTIHKADWSYGMNSSKKSSEIIITSR